MAAFFVCEISVLFLVFRERHGWVLLVEYLLRHDCVISANVLTLVRVYAGVGER